MKEEYKDNKKVLEEYMEEKERKEIKKLTIEYNIMICFLLALFIYSMVYLIVFFSTLDHKIWGANLFCSENEKLKNTPYSVKCVKVQKEKIFYDKNGYVISIVEGVNK